MWIKNTHESAAEWYEPRIRALAASRRIMWRRVAALNGVCGSAQASAHANFGKVDNRFTEKQHASVLLFALTASGVLSS